MGDPVQDQSLTATSRRSGTASGWQVSIVDLRAEACVRPSLRVQTWASGRTTSKILCVTRSEVPTTSVKERPSRRLLATSRYASSKPSHDSARGANGAERIRVIRMAEGYRGRDPQRVDLINGLAHDEAIAELERDCGPSQSGSTTEPTRARADPACKGGVSIDPPAQHSHWPGLNEHVVLRPAGEGMRDTAAHGDRSSHSPKAGRGRSLRLRKE